MAFVDLLRSARTSPVAIKHEFRSTYGATHNQIHAFYEGHNDAAFYAGFIRSRMRGDSRFYWYNCRGKRGVLQARAEVRQTHPSADRVLFFIDKDLDDLLGSGPVSEVDVFETEHYSIENYVVCEQAFERWVGENLRVSTVAFEASVLREHFAKSLAAFWARIRPIMAWVLAHRRAASALNLANINLRELIWLDNDALPKTHRPAGGRIAYLDRVTGVTTTPAIMAAVKRAMGELTQLSEKCWVRGKFEAWFMVKYCQLVRQTLAAAAAEAGGQVGQPTSMHEENVVELLAPRIAEPGPLSEFLDRHLGGRP